MGKLRPGELKGPAEDHIVRARAEGSKPGMGNSKAYSESSSGVGGEVLGEEWVISLAGPFEVSTFIAN